MPEMAVVTIESPHDAIASHIVTGHLRLVLLSSLMLFLELALIRWSSENVLYLSYFSNLVLLASFLGIGLGFLRGTGRSDLFRWAPWLLFAFVTFVSIFPVRVAQVTPHRILTGLGSLPALPEWLELPLVFFGVVAVMGCVAHGVAGAFSRFEPLEAYRLDILGSLLGIGAFTILQFVGPHPIFWGAVVGLLLLLTEGRTARVATVLGSVGVLAVLAIGSLSSHSTWSPYYRVSIGSADAGAGPGSIAVLVNGRPHQTMLDIDGTTGVQPFYQWPYEHLTQADPQDVLIIGAGTGNDVAVALQHGARSVDAVEIDPVLQELGAQLHPDQPYEDPRVHVVIDDGRAFMEQTSRTYDLIEFALPDSLTLVSGQAGLRLESYLLTREAMEAAKDLLKPGGVFAMYNYYLPVTSDRFGATLLDVYGRVPCQVLGTSTRFGDRTQAVFLASSSKSAIECDTPWDPAQASGIAPSTDDHPFPYLAGKAIPGYYLLALALVLAVSILAIRTTVGSLRSMRPYVDLFFMGAAFLLLETKSVIQFALLFGSTWIVNALVFGGVLLAVLVAIEIAKRIRVFRPRMLYAALLGTLALAWLVPVQPLLGLPWLLRLGAAVALSFTPILLANLVFAERFKDTANSTFAFGANLLGAMLGGTLEYASITIGYRNLLVLAVILYALAFIAGRRSLRAAAAAG
jgi:hypothetical protein